MKSNKWKYHEAQLTLGQYIDFSNVLDSAEVCLSSESSYFESSKATSQIGDTESTIRKSRWGVDESLIAYQCYGLAIWTRYSIGEQYCCTADDIRGLTECILECPNIAPKKKMQEKIIYRYALGATCFILLASSTEDPISRWSVSIPGLFLSFFYVWRVQCPEKYSGPPHFFYFQCLNYLVVNKCFGCWKIVQHKTFFSRLAVE